ncbi:MAG: acyltransferase [Verrucomicrobia bacterium]|nr:acyltransferase [Verrucomicrobiota bacterium]
MSALVHSSGSNQAAESGDKFPAQVNQQRSPRVFGLDLLRATAITLVYIAHGFGVLMPHLPWWAGFLGHFGFYGVEMFFVLSGFLIGAILIRLGERLRDAREVLAFYVRRWFRTLPLFLLFVLLNVILFAVVLHHHFTAGEIVSHALFLRNLTGSHLSFFGESWSLAVEEWFYLLFPVALWIGLRTRYRFDQVLLAVAALFFLFSNAARVWTAADPQATWTEFQREGVFLRFDALMLGVFAAWLALRYPGAWKKFSTICAVAGLLLLALLYASLWRVRGHSIGVSADDFFARTFRFTLVSLGFALLLPFASGWKITGENVATRNVHRIALWSYALYLVHTPVVLLVSTYGPPQPVRSALEAGAIFAAQTALCLAISALLYRYYESRCTHLRDTVAPAVARRFAGSGRPKPEHTKAAAT